MSTQVEAYVYDFEYFIDFIHGHRNKIKEIFIPSLGICFNTAENQFNVFQHDAPRNVISQVKSKFTDEALELAKTSPKLAKLIEETKARELPEKTTDITHIRLDQTFVDKLLEIVKMDEYKKQVEKTAKEYLKN